MNTILWIAQILLALVFGLTGAMKLIRSREELQAMGMGFVADVSDTTVRLIGLLEVSGALGVIFPYWLGILPLLTPLAAGGLVFTMIGAALVHLRREEYSRLPVNLILLAMALFVVWGRL